jgi:hypothetical protein
MMDKNHSHVQRAFNNKAKETRTMRTEKEKETNNANHFEDSMCRNTKQKSSIHKSLVRVNRNFEG